jgi:uncharacterized membrane protein
MKKNPTFPNSRTLFDLLILLVVFSYLLSYFKPSLIFSKTTISGGDTGSHNYLVYYMKNYLLPHRKLVGWSPDWYAGFPIFQFYFPLPYLIAALLSYLIPIEIAFKSITVLGIFLLPACAYLSFRLMDFKFPVPIIASIFTLPFLFLESFSMWGGNILSTLAGQFAFTLSLSLTILFMGGFYRFMKTRSERLLILNAILLTLIVLSHIIPVIIIVLSSSFYLLNKEKTKNFIEMSKLFILAFFLAAFWAVPFATKRGYATAGNFLPTRELGLLFPKQLVPFLLIAILGIVFWNKNKDDRIDFILFSLVISLVLFFIAPKGFIWNARFLPFYYLFSMLIAAYGLTELLKKIEPKWIFTLIVLFGTILIINSSLTKVSHWIEWNYSGFEGKNTWNTYSTVNKFLRELPDGRVIHEYSNSHNSFGTPRAFESIPYFAGKPVMEGLLIESAISSPFHFFLQAEISKEATCPIAGLKCPSFDLERATKHMKLFNIRYILATTAKLKDSLRDYPDFTFLNRVDNLEIHELETDGMYVVPLKFEPILIQTNNWRELSQDWFKNGDLDVPLVFVNKINHEEIKNFKLIGSDIASARRIPINERCDITETIDNEEILIKTSCIGRPLLVKVPYFPNWKVEGAEKIYLATPSFMIIFPTDENVRIYYGNTLLDIAGKILSIIGVLIILISFNTKTRQLLKLRSNLFESLLRIYGQNLIELQRKFKYSLPSELIKELGERYFYKFLLFGGLVAYTFYLSKISIARHNVFGTSGFDLGIFDQGLWLLSQGKTPFITVRGLHLFGDHVSLILLFLSPIYWIWSDVRALLFFQSFSLAIGAIPIYLLSKDIIKSKKISLAFSISYLLYPPLGRVNFWHFHPEALATTFLLFAFYFVIKEKYLHYYVFSFLALICKEEISLVVFLMGLYVFSRHNKQIGLITSIIALSWFVLSIKIILPHFNSVGYFRLSGGYGASWVGSLFREPHLIISKVFTQGDGEYLFKLLSPVGFLPILSPIILAISTPILLTNMVGGGYMETIMYQYTALIIPFIFISSIYGLSKIYTAIKFEKKETLLAVILLLTGVFGNYYWGISPVSKTHPSYIEDDRVKTLNKAISQIPEDASVTADPFIVPHLTHREFIYEFPNPFKIAYWGANGENPHDPETIEYIALKRDSLSKENKELVDHLTRDDGFTVVFEEENAIILKRN